MSEDGHTDAAVPSEPLTRCAWMDVCVCVCSCTYPFHYSEGILAGHHNFKGLFEVKTWLELGLGSG